MELRRSPFLLPVRELDYLTPTQAVLRRSPFLLPVREFDYSTPTQAELRRSPFPSSLCFDKLFPFRVK